MVTAKEGGKSGKQKGGFFKSSRSGIKLGRTNHFACVHSVQTENLHRTGCTYQTREKTCKNQLQIAKRKLPKLKGTLHKSKIPLLSRAALLQEEPGRTRKSLSLLHCHGHRKGSLAKAENCAVSPPHLLRPSPGCTLRRNVPQADSPHRLSDVLCCHRGRGVSVPCPSPHMLGSPSIPPGTF